MDCEMGRSWTPAHFDSILVPLPIVDRQADNLERRHIGQTPLVAGMVAYTSEIPMRTHKLLRSRAVGHLTPSNRTRWLLLALLTGLLVACGSRADAGLPVTPTTSLIVDSSATVLPPTAVAPTNLWSGTWESDCGAFGCGTVSLAQSGEGVNGTFGVNGTIIGLAERNRLEGDWVQNGVDGSFALTMADDGQSWVGTMIPGSRWCGWRSATPRPRVCMP